MNVVLSALIIVLLLYPGIFFRAVYFRGTRFDGIQKIKYNVLRQPVWEQVISSVVPAFLIHILCIQVIYWLTPWQIDYQFIYNCLLGRPIDQFDTTKETDIYQPNIGLYLLEFAVYLSQTFTLALFAAIVARDYVFRKKLDSKYPILRFSNEWFYWLTGRILETNTDNQQRTVDLIGIHILAETKENTIIYDGFLYDFTLSETNNGLDRLVLFYASKSVFKKTSTSRKQVSKGDETMLSVEDVVQSELYERAEKRQIQQEYIIVPYAQIRNLTITYIDLRSDEQKNDQ